MTQPFKAYYGVCCGGQAMVTDTKGRLIKAIPGSREVWLCLTDDEGKIQSRIGQLHICPKCTGDLKNFDCDKILEKLHANKNSGVPKDTVELGILKGPKHLELIRRFGD